VIGSVKVVDILCQPMNMNILRGFAESVEMNDYLTSLLVGTFFIMGFWLGVHWIKERQK